MSSDRPRISRPVRTPTVLQMEAVECGAAALGIILEYHGRYVPLDILRVDCGVSRDGSNAFYIKEAARRYGLEAKAFRKDFEGLKTRIVPFIVFWQWNHFLVVEGFAHNRVYLNDPACGRRTVGEEEFRRGYTGIALSFTPGPDFVKQGRRPSTLIGLSRRLAASRIALAFVILAGLVLVFPNLITAGFQGIFIDEILVQGRRDWLRPLLIAMGLTAALKLAAVALQQVYLTRLEVRLALAESVRFFQHVLRLPMSFYQARYAGDIVYRMISTGRLAQLMSGELATTSVSLLTLIIYVAAMLPYDSLLTLVGVAIGGLNLVALRWFSRWRTDQNRSIEQIRGRLMAGVMWAIQIIETVKATGSESDLMVRWTGDQARMVDAEQRRGTYDTSLLVLPPLLATLTTIAVLGLGGYQVITGVLSIGGLVAFQTLLAAFNQPFQDLARLGTEVQDLRADLDRIDDVCNCRVDPVFEPPLAAPAASLAGTGNSSLPPRLSGNLELRAVTFGYNRTVEDPLIKDFSLVIRPGQRVALVGGSGSGKSTLARLIAGLYQPWKGEILYDGKAIHEIPREIFVNSVGLVDERICMFQGTVRENLTLWDDHVSSQRLIEAGLGAAIHRDLLQRRGGYDAAVAEQARNFSGGQRQRMEIARALVREPSLLILDEATSALDSRTESVVDDQLRRRGCSCLIIAHRLSTIRDCDEIVVLSAGRILQRGTHETLVAEGDGEYARLISSQSASPRRGVTVLGHHPSLPPRILARMARAASQAAASSVNSTTVPIPTQPPPVEPRLDAALSLPGFLIEELVPFSRPEQTAANRPLRLDDAEAVWWVSGGQVDVFFARQEPGGGLGRRRHLCRVEEGGSIFAVSGVSGGSEGVLLAVGVGTAQLLKFARGDLIRLSFEENLAEQVAVLIDDWIVRVSRAVGELAAPVPREQVIPGQVLELPAGVRFGVKEGVAWVRHLRGRSRFLEENPLPVSELEARFPLTEHHWLTALGDCQVTACDTVAMVRTGDPWAGLMDFHRAVLDEIARIQKREDEDSRVEIQDSISAEASMLDSFSERLAAVANETTVWISPSGGPALLAACRAVGNEMVQNVRPPRKLADGSGGSEEDLPEIARASGFHIRQVTLSENWAEQGDGQPLLARLRDEGNRPVALLPARGRSPFSKSLYDLFDPVDGTRRGVDETLARRVGPIAWVFYKTLPDHALRMRDLVRFSLASGAKELRLFLTLALIIGLLGLAVPVASGILVDQVIPDAEISGSSMPRLLALCIFLVVLTVSAAIFQAVQGLALLRLEGKVVPSLVPAVWDRLLRLPTRFYGEFSAGDLALRAMGLTTIFKKISGAAASTLVTGLVSILNLGLLFWYSWKLALIVLLLLGVLAVITIFLLATQLRQETAIRRVEGALIGFLLEVVGGIMKLRTAGAENRAFARWAERYGEQLALTIRSRRFSNHLHRLFAIFPSVIAIVVYFGAIHLDPGGMRTGSFLAFMIALGNVVAAILAAGHTLLGLLDLPPLYARVRPILEAEPEFPAAVIEPVRLMGALALNSVSFRYAEQPEGARVLEDVNLQVRPGEFVAVVGSSGSGKSTLLRLLLGFETPHSGTVTYDGRELATLDLREVRRQIGVVLQQAQLMPGDLFTNIVGFAPDLTMDDAWRAAKLAGIEDDIRRLPMGMHTLVGEGGGNLSGGQRQRLIIARAIVRRPRILFFDEATSALDNITQAVVTDSITRELRGVTRIVIAHRLNTVVQADRIYVIKEGRIAQVGHYDQLMNEPGAFQELVHRQSV